MSDVKEELNVAHILYAYHCFVQGVSARTGYVICRASCSKSKEFQESGVKTIKPMQDPSKFQAPYNPTGHTPVRLLLLIALCS